jgi:hypothetical protein
LAEALLAQATIFAESADALTEGLAYVLHGAFRQGVTSCMESQS